MQEHRSTVDLAAVPALALAVYCVVGIVDRPWLRSLHVSSWTPWLITCSVAYRLGGGQGFVVPVAVHLERCPTRLGAAARDAAGIWLAATAARWAVRLRRATWAEVKTAAVGAALEASRRLPPVRRRIAAEFAKVEADLRASLKKDAERPGLTRLPEEPVGTPNEIASRLRSSSDREDATWRRGSVSGTVYHGQKDHLELLNAAMAAYCVANPLHADQWPTVAAMEAEIVSMTARLVDGGDAEVCGALTSGGTESIILAAKTHRDRAADARGRPISDKFEVVACVTAHAALDKACELLGMRLVKVRAAADFRADLAAVRRALSADTVMVYASAPSFPHGVVDDVVALARLARAHGLGCHVDCCLGGFVLPFLDHTPPFDFRLPGVTSMSLDTHKYGFAPKGTSVVLYRSAEWRKYQYFCYPDWTGGLYATPTLPGSRNGALVAAAWASLVSLGRRGLRDRAKRIHRAANTIAAGVARIPRLRLLGAAPDCSVPAMIVCFASDDHVGLDIYAVNDALVSRGWALNALQHPPCLHLCCTLLTCGHEDRFLADLRAALDDVARAPPGAPSGSAAIYGMASSMPAGPVAHVMRLYTDILLTVPDPSMTGDGASG